MHRSALVEAPAFGPSQPLIVLPLQGFTGLYKALQVFTGLWHIYVAHFQLQESSWSGRVAWVPSQRNITRTTHMHSHDFSHNCGVPHTSSRAMSLGMMRQCKRNVCCCGTLTRIFQHWPCPAAFKEGSCCWRPLACCFRPFISSYNLFKGCLGSNQHWEGGGGGRRASTSCTD